ncbi:hypothetical protein DFH08DRAFT_977487 [Mycena albidolilacea]|uniref:DUF6534 domain-containing protein n=1 Tax=Mycena albidolilacea TaxID=1033008 RepID=A0AAD6Z188_9AGAR|nr:hypothetical protein DFH08DRAFT_977487 [Mycena albidolilacea]
MDATIEIGTVLSGVLFGLITSQTVYFKTFPKDSRFCKVWVGALWIVELVHTACIFNALYMYTVTGYGDPSSLERFPVSLSVSIALHGAAVIIVQFFFTYRISKFVQKMHYLFVVAVCLLFVRFVAFIVLGAAAAKMTALSDFMRSWKPLILFDLISCGATDVMMSSFLVYQLARGRSYVHQRTLALMDKLIMWSVETCLVTTASTVAIIICFLTMGENFVWLGVLLVQPKIFSNALLANLNSRSAFRDAASSNFHEMTLSRPHFSPGRVTMSKQSETFNDKFLQSPAQDSFPTTDSPVEEIFSGPSTPVDAGGSHAIAFDSMQV